jgi:UDP-N-acetylmuramoyl-tripeptide--D-alanyl-D-alanine ligase
MVYTTIAIVFTAVSLVGAWLAFRYYLHMFQLNGYKPQVQRKWARENARWAIFLPLVGGFFFWPREAKKPLDYTPRVRRVIAAAVLLAVAWVALLWLLSLWMTSGAARMVWRMFFAFMLQRGAADWVLLANGINRPVEKAINKRYINEAKRKLAQMSALTVIGITGSFGKTSVKHYLNTLLRVKYNVCMTPGGVNTPMGVVRCVREELDAAHEIFLCEMGAKNVGDIKELCELVRPRHGVLTSIGPQHLESFHTLENVIATKFELAHALPLGGILFANASDESIAGNLAKHRHVVRYGAGDYTARHISVNERGTTFEVAAPQGETETFTTCLVGAHNVVNLLGAIAVANTLGVPLQSLRGQIRKITAVPHRLELQDHGNMLILDDGYNSNPAGAKAALDALALFEGMKILVTPGMIELGTKQEELNHAFGAQAAAVCDAIALVGEKQTKPIATGILEAGFAPERLIVAETLQAAMAQVRALPCDGRKVILLENDLPDNY